MPHSAPASSLPDVDETYYRLLAEHVVDYAIFLLDAEGRVATWTQGARRILGWTEEEALGRPLSLFYPPGDVDRGLPGRDLRAAVEEGRCDALAWRVRRDGSRLWAAMVLTALRDAAGRPVGFGAIVRDLTDRHEVARRYDESRQRYRSLFEQNPHAILSFDRGGALTGANAAACALVGCAPGELDRARLRAAFAEEDRDRIRALFARAGRGEAQRVETALRRPDDGRVELELTLVPIVVGEEVRGVYCIAEDVTARRRVEAEREELLLRERAARSEAESASRAKSDFLGVISHELKTPLNVISGYADLIADGVAGPVTPVQARHLERIRASTRELLGLIGEILDHARADDGREEVRRAPVDLADLAETAAAEAAPRARDRGLRLRVDRPAGPCAAETDAELVSHVLHLLLSNALKFTAPGDEVEVGVRREDGEVRLWVRDSGPGIAREHLDRIWEPFWQAEHSTVRRAGGAGLGLSRARRLARLLGGSLEASSTLGRGSVFTLRISA